MQRLYQLVGLLAVVWGVSSAIVDTIGGFNVIQLVGSVHPGGSKLTYIVSAAAYLVSAVGGAMLVWSGYRLLRRNHAWRFQLLTGSICQIMLVVTAFLTGQSIGLYNSVSYVVSLKWLQTDAQTVLIIGAFHDFLLIFLNLLFLAGLLLSLYGGRTERGASAPV